MLKAISGWDGWMAMEISVSTSSKSTALRAVLIIMIIIIIMSNKKMFQTHHFVATAVDETLATFGANLSEMCQIIEMVQ